MTTASVLIRDIAGPTGRILIGRRVPGGPWEFPSGKTRTGETSGRFVARIVWEQLGIDVSVGRLQMRGRKKTPEALYDDHEYYDAVNIWKMTPKTDAFAETAWVHPSELSRYEFGGDDRNFIAKYFPWVTGGEIPDVRMY